MEVMKTTSFKRSHASLLHSCPQPCIRPPPTHTSIRDSWTLTGKSRSKFWWLYGGVNGNRLQEGLCHSSVCSTQSPCPSSRPLLTHLSAGDTQTQFCLSLCGVSGSWCPQGLFEPSEHLWWVWGLSLYVILPFLPSCWGCSFALGCVVSFFGGIQHFPVNSYSAASCNFEVLSGDEHMSFCSTIL